jgi:hypothetical protein
LLLLPREGARQKIVAFLLSRDYVQLLNSQRRSQPAVWLRKTGRAIWPNFDGEDNLVAGQMSEFRATANAHMRRDMQVGGKWLCQCTACGEIRSLVGMDKMLDVWPLVRELRETTEQLNAQPDGPERQTLLERHFKLYDQLAEEMAK